jgi:hypothetical protein
MGWGWLIEREADRTLVVLAGKPLAHLTEMLMNGGRGCG